MTEWFEGRSIDEQMERCYWRRVGFIVVLAAILAAVLFPLMAYSSPLFKSKDKNEQPVSLRLFDEPCREKVAVHIKPQFVHLFKRASLLWAGKYWESCWVEVDGVVMSVDEEGAPFQPVPLAAFLDDTI